MQASLEASIASARIGSLEAEQVSKKVTEWLLSNEICSKCILRLLGVDPCNLYTPDEDTLRNLILQAAKSCGKIESDCPTILLESFASICSICLGALQVDSYGCHDALKQSKHKQSNINMRISLPPVILLREHLHQLTCTSDVSYRKAVVEAKQVIRYLIAQQEDVAIDDSSTLVMNLVLSHAETQNEIESAAIESGIKLQRKKQFKLSQADRPGRGNNSNPLARQVLNRWQKVATIPYNPKKPSEKCVLSINLVRDPVYLMGNYCKYRRGVSLSPWFIGGVRKGSSSVQELIAEPILRGKWFQDSHILTSQGETATTQTTELNLLEHKFHTAGREDIDVRMLGKGRPFVLELLDAHRDTFSPSELEEMQNCVNNSTSDIQINSLRVDSSDSFQLLKDGADTKQKKYACVCWTEVAVSAKVLREKLDAQKNLSVQQQTPIRVLHRRSQLVRSKQVLEMSTEWINNHYFILHLTTSAGTYVKEFVHGDRGRTCPSVSSFLNSRSEILQLDVEDLVMEPKLTH